MRTLHHPGTLAPRGYAASLDRAAHYAVAADNRRSGRSGRYSVWFQPVSGAPRGIGESDRRHAQAVKRALELGVVRYTDEAGTWTVREDK